MVRLILAAPPGSPHTPQQPEVTRRLIQHSGQQPSSGHCLEHLLFLPWRFDSVGHPQKIVEALSIIYCQRNDCSLKHCIYG